jgi:hypothetical protein
MSTMSSSCLLFYTWAMQGPGVAGGRGADHPRHQDIQAQAPSPHPHAPHPTSRELNGLFCVA